MQHKIEKLPKSVIKFHITATKEEVAQFFVRAIEKLAKDLKLPGFRPGKVPHDMVKDTIGEQAIENEARELAINDSYFETINQNKLIPLVRPNDIKINKFSEEEGLDWEGSVEVLPEIKLNNWKEKLKASKVVGAYSNTPIQADDKEVEETIKNLQKQFASLEVKVGNTEKGDWVDVDIDIVEKEKFTPEQVKKFQAKGFSLVIGEANFIPGFEDELTDLEKGAEKEFDATFPKEYMEKSVAGKKVKFKIKLNEIKKVILAVANDEFAKKFGKENIDDLKKAIKEDLQNRKEQAEKARFEDEAIKEVVKNSEYEVPETLLEQEKEMILERFKHDLEHHKGIGFSEYLASLGKSKKEVKDGFFEQAENNVKIGLVLGQITKNENVAVDDKDVEEVMSVDILRQTTGLDDKSAKEAENRIKERYQDEEFVSSIKNSILARKTIDLIIDQIK